MSKQARQPAVSVFTMPLNFELVHSSRWTPWRAPATSACHDQQKLRGSSSAGFWLVPTERTLALAAAPVPSTGRLASEGAPSSLLHFGHYWRMRHWRHLQHVIVRALATHPSCSSTADAAALCIVAEPLSGGCDAWEHMCPGKRLLVISYSPDVELQNPPFTHLCPTVWSSIAHPRLARVTGNLPFKSKPRFPCGYAERASTLETLRPDLADYALSARNHISAGV